MARRKGLLDELAALPWPVPAVLGVAASYFVRHVGGFLPPLAPACLLSCWAAAFVSFLNARRRRVLLERQTGLDSIAAIRALSGSAASQPSTPIDLRFPGEDDF